jgi:hypothetical protein
LLRTLQAPPPQGSLQEWALILLIDRLEDIDHARLRALAQILINKEEGAKAFEEYTRIAFPSMQKRKEKRDDEMKKMLRAWTSTGPVKVIPLHEARGRSKLKQRHIQVEGEMAARIYGKIR